MIAKTMKKILILLLSLISVITFANTVTLVKDGIANAEIILGSKPSRSSSLGAYELQYHIKKITGTELPIVTTATSGNNVKIYVGDFPGSEKQKYNGERIIRRFEKNNIILTGTDSSTREKFDYNDHKTFPFGLPEEEYGYNGPLFAVYDFLEDLCDVRFFYYNDKGTAFTPTKTLTVKKINRDHSPKFNAFRIIHTSRQKDTLLAGSLRDVKLANLRWRMTQFYGNTNHNGYSIYFTHWGKAKRKTLQNSFKEKRKEYFAQGYDGQGPQGDPIIRSNYSDDKDCPAQLCYSNPGTIKYFADEALTYAKGGCAKGGWLNFHGKFDTNKTLIPRFENQPFFYPVEPGDSQKDKVCLCPSCKKRVAPGAANISEHKFRFIAAIADEIAKHDKNAGISTLAYIRSLYYPENVKLPENVSVQLCLPIYSWWHPVAYEKQHGEYKKWVKNESSKRPLTLWTYLFTTEYDANVHFGKYKAFPGFYPEHTIDIFKEFADDGIRGLFTETVKTHLFTEAYLATRICYDNTLSKEEMLNDYFSKCYGKAAPYIREFYKEIEKVYWNSSNCPPSWLKDKNILMGPKGAKHPFWSTGLWSQDVNWKNATQSRMKKLSALLDKAEKNLTLEHEKFMFSKLREIWNNALKGHQQYYEFARLKHSRSILMQKTADANGDASKIDWSKFQKSDIFTDSVFKKVKRDVFFQTAYDSKYAYFRVFENETPAKNENMHDGHGFEMVFSADGNRPNYYMLIEPSGKYYCTKFIMESDVIRKESFDFSPIIKSVSSPDSWNCYFSIPLNKLPFKNGSMTANMIRVRPKKDYAVWNATGSYDCQYKLEEAGKIIKLPYTINSSNFEYKDKKLTRREKDSASADGFTGSIDFGYSWGLQIPIPSVFNGKYNLDIYLRSTELPADTYFRIFVYDTKKKKIIYQKSVPPESVSNKNQYSCLSMKNIDINPDCYITVSSFNKKSNMPGKIFVEKLVIK